MNTRRNSSMSSVSRLLLLVHFLPILFVYLPANPFLYHYTMETYSAQRRFIIQESVLKLLKYDH